MSRHDPVQDLIESVAAAARVPEDPASAELFRKALRGKHNLPAARAAQAAARNRLAQLVPDLAAAFNFFMTEAARRDPRCAAKIAIAEALDQMEASDSDLFLQGLRHVQLESAWGGTVDTAAPLRARSMAALVRLNHPDRYRLLADLLFDPCPEARRGAVQAAAFAGGDPGELLLRLKVHVGDKDLSIIGDCFSGLLQLAPEASLDFVGSYLQSAEPELRELAALAVGESRLQGALGLLRSAVSAAVGREESRTFCLAIGLCRTDEAFEFLLEFLEDKPAHLASAAIEGLELYRADPERWKRVSRIVVSRGLDERAR